MERASMRQAIRGALVVLLVAGRAFAAGTLVNGDLAAGEGNVPTGWQPVFWSPTASVFSWSPPSTQGGGGVLRITSTEGNDAKWCQTVAVEPGTTYRVAAEARAIDVGSALYGAIITVEPRVGDSEDLRGTTPWRPLEVTLNAGELSSWDVCLRLGNYANLNTGTAEFRNVTLTALDAPRKIRWSWNFKLPEGWTTHAADALPVLGGLLLAFGFGIFRRRR